MEEPAVPLNLRLLVLRCQIGDRASLDALFGHFQPRLRGYVFKMLPRGGPALEDVMQDVWADVLRDLPNLADAGAFAPWLYRIARNRVLRAICHRRDRRMASIHELDISGAEADEPFSPADAAAVHRAMDLLPAQQREVLLLRFMEDMGYEDIATVVGCPIGTVRSRIHNGKRSLRAILERQASDVAR
jgi:RNA polymerase sigma-70 factor (ECF subfamily)